MCNTCLSDRCGNLSSEEFDQRIQRKEEALQEKASDKETGPLTTLAVCEDTQGLLVSPKNDSNAMYYRTKLNVPSVKLKNAT